MLIRLTSAAILSLSLGRRLAEMPRRRPRLSLRLTGLQQLIKQGPFISHHYCHLWLAVTRIFESTYVSYIWHVCVYSFQRDDTPAAGAGGMGICTGDFSSEQRVARLSWGARWTPWSGRKTPNVWGLHRLTSFNLNIVYEVSRVELFLLVVLFAFFWCSTQSVRRWSNTGRTFNWVNQETTVELKTRSWFALANRAKSLGALALSSSVKIC